MNWRGILCWFRGHDLRLVDSVVDGATLTWAATVTRSYRFDYVCERCQATIAKGGFYLAGDRKRNPDKYDESGWPLDDNGDRLPIAGGES